MIQYKTHLLYSFSDDSSVRFDEVKVDYFVDENDVEQFEFQQLLNDYCPYEIPPNKKGFVKVKDDQFKLNNKDEENVVYLDETKEITVTLIYVMKVGNKDFKLDPL